MARIDDLIGRHGLHKEGAPVDLSPLRDEFIRHIGPVANAELPAFSIPPTGEIVTIHSPAQVILNEMFPENWRRLYYAHEIGHVICGHVGTFRSFDAGQWWYRQDENEAWEVAALLLIPEDVIEDGDTHLDAALRCQVPVWLAERHPFGRPPLQLTEITIPKPPRFSLFPTLPALQCFG